MLIQFDEISLELAQQPILTKVHFVLHPAERVCLIGRNGAGKSTLMKLIMGQMEPDAGEILYKEGLRISQLEQNLPHKSDQSVWEILKDGLSNLQALIEQYHRLSREASDARKLNELEKIQRAIETGGGWHIEQQLETIITQLNLPAEKKLSELSGGWKRRVMLGKALVSQPELLLLDEPTNHLDISTIEWLEHTIRSFDGTVLFVTHDRRFLQKLSTRVIELDRGQLRSFPGDYHEYLKRKEKMLEDEQAHNALFDKKLAQEEAWIRQGIKARRTRNEGRVRALHALREERGQRLEVQGKARIAVQSVEQSGRKVIEARHITHGYDEQILIGNFSVKIRRGDRIGLVGNNGLGKSTLLRILLGDLQPDQGSVKLGVNLEIAWFDQMRQGLDLEKTVAYNVGEGKDYIKINGKDRHVVGYLKDFLFTPQRSLTPVKVLSGGERNRVLLAKLFARPCNLLVLDEPTNDLDIEMLEALEERLIEYNGTLLVVSHDRDFLDNVVTSLLVYEEDGRIHEYVGGYSDWARLGKTLAEVENPYKKAGQIKQASVREIPVPKKQQKLSYHLNRELSLLPEKIEQLEQEIEALQTMVSDPGFYNQPHEPINQTLAQLSEKQSLLEQAMERWIELEQMQQGT